ncbi:MAG: hypothetical protein WGN25_12800 [Candidatus Electrothrix sp. GW3-4]|uniref:hypothetical protein n=1 Tax=Candidatus Electrothrix sp. GW3-4 TaxID=3126740 RepID=UPI0030D53F92
MLNHAFYRRCYLQTGWLPMQPLTRKIHPGELCQIQNGYLQPLLTLTDLHLEVDVEHSPSLPLNPLGWCLDQDVQQIYSGTGQEQNDEGHIDYWSKQVVSLKRPGSFIFHGHEPRCRLITNWSALKEDITLQVTQGRYSFREVYCITAVAKVERWGLAIAGGKRARLEMTAATSETDSFLLLSHESAKIEQCHNIDCP